MAGTRHGTDSAAVSFLMGAAMRMEGKIHTMAARAVMAVLGSRGLHGSEMAELIHLPKHVAHDVKELGEDLVESRQQRRTPMTTSAEFVDRAVTAAADLALFYVGTSDEKIETSLDRVRQNLEADLASPFGPDIAASIAREFVKAVAGRRREIDGAGSMRSNVLN